MSVSFIPVMCYYNGHIVRTDNDVKYDGNKASIVPWKYRLTARSNNWVISFLQAHLLTNGSST